MSIPIVHLRSTFQVGGPEKLILSGIQHMQGDDFTFTLSSFSLPARPNRFAEYASSLGIPVVQIAVNGSFDRRALDGVRRLVENTGARLLVVHDYRAVIIALMAGLRLKVPIMAVAHGWTSQSLRVRMYEYIERFALRRVDAVVAVSKPKFQELLKIGVAESRLTLIENGVEIPPREKMARDTRLKDDLGLPHDTLLIGSVGRLSPEKGHRFLVDAATRLAPANPNARFVIFGEGPLRSSLLAQIRRAGLDHLFFLPGWRTDMENVYRGLDLFALPSLTEGLPMALLEAMSFGLPSVATTVGGCPDVIEDHVSGFLVPPSSVSALTDALGQLLVDEPLRDRMTDSAYDRIADRYSMTRYASQFAALYHQLAGGDR